METANYASYKIGLVRVSSVICKTLHTNISVNMYYVNIKIKTKNTVGIAKKNCDLLALFISSKVSGREVYGCGTL